MEKIELMRLIIADIVLFNRQRDNLSLQQIHKAMVWSKTNHEREFREGMIKQVETDARFNDWSELLQDFREIVLAVNSKGLSENLNEVIHELIEEERTETLNIKHNQ